MELEDMPLEKKRDGDGEDTSKLVVEVKAEGKKTEGNPRLYRAGCLLLTLICLVLLMAVIVLSVKQLDEQQCGEGWLLFENTCFYLSTVRLNWSMSKNNCTAGKGDLAVISSQSVQTFLTRKANDFFWIGLKHDANRWRWVDNSALGDSYWEGSTPRQGCGLLKGLGSPQKNWISSSCTSKAYFICEKQA
ncbi:unnamed protein product [Pleuronectes platessa]|uniref:C-type lectin domain-containing protein n=1 Tax=Pleuronectes platessa TaxID=8262 RepID=A0A9N7VAR1_PLEPL|nr:unnamed protein product [Pleuronectes platessa]